MECLLFIGGILALALLFGAASLLYESRYERAAKRKAQAVLKAKAVPSSMLTLEEWRLLFPDSCANCGHRAVMYQIMLGQSWATEYNTVIQEKPDEIVFFCPRCNTLPNNVRLLGPVGYRSLLLSDSEAKGLPDWPYP